MKKKKLGFALPQTVLDWLNAPKSPPNDHDDACWALVCEIQTCESRLRELEVIRPLSYTEDTAMRNEVATLRAEIARLNAELLSIGSNCGSRTSDPKRRLTRLRTLGGEVRIDRKTG